MEPLMESGPRRHRITVEDYHRMAEVGLLAGDARVELIEGDIVDMAPIGSLHGSVVDQLALLLFEAVGTQAIVRTQGPVRLSGITEPQPDFVLLKPRPDFYRYAQPAGHDALLVIEVSDSTLRYDREIKLPLYARHGVPEVWIVDLRQSRFLFFREPEQDGYRSETVTAEPWPTPVAALPSVIVDLSRLTL